MKRGPILGSRRRTMVSLSRKRTPESAVLKAVLMALAMDRRVAWFARMNTGALRTEERFIKFGSPGMPDVVGYLHGGRMLAVECKAKEGKLSALQREWLLRARDAGCCVGVARNAQDALDIVSGIKELE